MRSRCAGRDVVDHADVRPRDGGEVGDVARLAGAHLVDGELRVFGRVQHRQRQADLVVAVARRWRRCAPARSQDRQRQRLDAGLAVAAGDRDDLAGAALDTAALHRGREVGQRALGVGDDHLRRSTRRLRATPAPRATPACAAAATWSWPSKRSPLSATNSAAPPCGSARVSVATASTVRSSPCRRPAGHARNVGQAQRLHAASSQRRARDLRVVEGMLHAVDVLVGLVALAGDQHDVAGDRRRPIAWAIAAARSRCTMTCSRRAKPAMMSATIDVAVLVARVVVGDDDRRRHGARRSRPSAGACRDRVRRRSRTRRSGAPCACARSEVSACSSASGVCA